MSIREYIAKHGNVALMDDDSDFGGVSFAGETLLDFLSGCDNMSELRLEEVNDSLICCGIMPLVAF